jgi:hypothetical protein
MEDLDLELPLLRMVVSEIASLIKDSNDILPHYEIYHILEP